MNLELPLRVPRVIFDTVQLFKVGAAECGLEPEDQIPTYGFTSEVAYSIFLHLEMW